MYRNRIKTIELFLGILLIGGCAGKTDFTQGVSGENKKLLSSYTDKILYIKGDIRITKNGFYPNCNINSPKLKRSVQNKNKYMSKVASYLMTRKFNLKLFLEDVNKKHLKEFRFKLLKVALKYPQDSFDTSFIENEEELDSLLLNNPLKDRKKILSRIAHSIKLKNYVPPRVPSYREIQDLRMEKAADSDRRNSERWREENRIKYGL